MSLHRPALAIAAALALAGCTDDGPAEDAAVTESAPTTVTTAPPVALGVVASLDLQVGQCYAPVPPPAEDPATTSTGVPPLPPLVVADCAGSHTGQVYATFCLVADPTGDLVAGGCPGDPATPWPGDRELRRAAVRLCLERFEQVLGEPYATTTRTAFEHVPTEGVWIGGDHRVVCAASPPEPQAG